MKIFGYNKPKLQLLYNQVAFDNNTTFKVGNTNTTTCTIFNAVLYELCLPLYIT